jgi:hypothetical protein
LRKDTLSHAYELMKVTDPRKRRRLADKVARGELTLIKLRERIEGRPARAVPAPPIGEAAEAGDGAAVEEAQSAWTGRRAEPAALRDDSLVAAKQGLADAVEALLDVLRAPDVVESFGEVDRTNLAKYLTIAKLRLENAIAMVRSGESS